MSLLALSGHFNRTEECPLLGVKRTQRDDGTIVLFTGSVPSFRRHEWVHNSGMQVMRLLAASGVTMAAGAMISLWFVVSPSLTLLPPLPAPVDASGTVTSQQHQTTETVGTAIDDSFEGREQSADDDIPAIPAPKRDPLEGLIGGLLTLPLAQDASQVSQIEPHDLVAAPQSEQQESVTAALQEPQTQPSDICARQGQRRVYYTQNHHRYWRCADRR